MWLFVQYLDRYDPLRLLPATSAPWPCPPTGQAQVVLQSYDRPGAHGNGLRLGGCGLFQDLVNLAVLTLREDLGPGDSDGNEVGDVHAEGVGESKQRLQAGGLRTPLDQAPEAWRHARPLCGFLGRESEVVSQRPDLAADVAQVLAEAFVVLVPSHGQDVRSASGILEDTQGIFSMFL